MLAGNKTIAIIGGGVSGALTAFHLSQKRCSARLVVIEPKADLGFGLAYSTTNHRHLLNVPAGKISALPEDASHFLTWLQSNHDPDAMSDTFAPRAVFGRYIKAIVSMASNIEHVRACAIDCQVHGSAATIVLDEGRELHAGFVVMATGNFNPLQVPGVASELAHSDAYCHDAWHSGTYSRLATDAPIILIGTGLTAVDVLLQLRAKGHRGIVTAVSRNGLLPARHSDYKPLEEPAIPLTTPPSCRSYLRALRSAIQSGLDWRAVIDNLRPISNDLWLALSIHERQRFRRHLQRRWEVVRHRTAPKVADDVERELSSSSLLIRQARVLKVQAAPGGVVVVTQTTKGIACFEAARVINCTGPNMNYRHLDSPLFQSLFNQGIATSGPLGSGFNTNSSGALVDARGEPSRICFNIGPGRLGTLIESIAIPEIREQAVALATLLKAKLDGT